VEDASKITVSLLDRRSFEAKLIGRDPTTDVAVIQITGSNFPTLPIGNDNTARIGSWVIAVGNPLGLDFTVTAGIISAKGRGIADLPRQTRYQITDFIQTDAAINPGNSGGPLLNARGEVIGVNSAIASQTGFYSGYGFAIPISLAKLVADDLIQYGRVRRAVLGISIKEVTPEEAKAAGLPTPAGVMVGTFDGAAANSPAREAGLQAGDVIVSIDGTPTDHPGALQRYIRSKKPGDQVNVDVMRFGDKKMFRVRLIEAPADSQQVASAGREMPEDDTPANTVSADRLGITVAPLTPDVARANELPGTVQGVRVMDVNPSGSAWRKLFAQSDIIMEVIFPRPRKAIRTPAELTQITNGLRAGDVLTVSVYNIQAREYRVETVRIGGN
jgi:serine protease Do